MIPRNAWKPLNTQHKTIISLHTRFRRCKTQRNGNVMTFKSYLAMFAMTSVMPLPIDRYVTVLFESGATGWAGSEKRVAGRVRKILVNMKKVKQKRVAR